MSPVRKAAKVTVKSRTIENRELRFTLRQLASELHKTREELHISQRENSRKEQRIKDLQEENSKLVSQVKSRRGLYPIK
jgi:septal ring factor EnvC (AmiA/AmiB activator)